MIKMILRADNGQEIELMEFNPAEPGTEQYNTELYEFADMIAEQLDLALTQVALAKRQKKN